MKFAFILYIIGGTVFIKMKASFNNLDVKFAFILYIIGVPVQYKI